MAKKTQKPRGSLTRAFITGLATLLPTVLTIIIITVSYNFLDEKIAQPITGLIRKGFSSEVAKQYFWKDTWSLQEWQLDETIDDSGLPERSGDIPFSQQVEQIIPNWLGFVIAIFLAVVSHWSSHPEHDHGHRHQHHNHVRYSKHHACLSTIPHHPPIH